MGQLGDIIVVDADADTSLCGGLMGGFGHSRVREFMPGGVTRSIFQSMTLPVLLSH